MTSGPLTNPFLPTEEAQRMMGGTYPGNDIARASLLQMNEISRRAELAGMSFAPATVNGRETGDEDPDPDRPNSALRMMADAAGLMDESKPMVSPTTAPSRKDTLARIEELHKSRPGSSAGMRDMTFGVNGTYDLPFDSSNNPASSSSGWAAGAGAADEDPGEVHEGLRVFTMGHLMPKSGQDDANGNWTYDGGSLGDAMLPALTVADTYQSASSPTTGSTPPSSAGRPSSSGSKNGITAVPSSSSPAKTTARSPTPQKLRVRRSTFVPGWAVPPRVLLVDDDEVNRRMSSKFLQVFGCTIDVAVDGLQAVNRMNLEKYDLVLMVCLYVLKLLVVHLSWSGHRYAETGRCDCDIDDSAIRSYDTYHFNDEQLTTE